MEKHKYFPHKITNGLEITSFLAGYTIPAVLIGNTLYSKIMQSYLMLMAIGLLVIYILKIVLNHSK